MEPETKKVKRKRNDHEYTEYTLPKQYCNTNLTTPEPNTDKPLNTLKTSCDINLTDSSGTETFSMKDIWEVLSRNTDSEIPLSTIRHLGNADDVKNALGIKELELTKIQPISIKNIFKSQKLDSKVFSFESSEYKLVKIKGVVIKIKSSVTSKTTIDVDDGTAVIRVFVDNSPDKIKYRSDVKKNIRQCCQCPTLESEEFRKLAETSNDVFFTDLSKEKEEAFLNTAALFFAKRTDKINIALFPIVTELKVSDNVSIIGRVWEFNKKRFMYGYSFKRHNFNFEEFCHQYEKDFCLNSSKMIESTSPEINDLCSDSDDDSTDGVF